MALTGVTKKLIKLIHTAVNNTAYIYKCSNKLNTHEDTMSMLKNKIHCTNIYSGTYDDEFILSCDNKIDFNPPAAATAASAAVVTKTEPPYRMWGLYSTLIILSIICFTILICLIKFPPIALLRKFVNYPSAVLKLIIFYVILVPLLLSQILVVIPIGWVNDTSDLGHIAFQLPITWYVLARLYFKLVNMSDDIVIAVEEDDEMTTRRNRNFCSCLRFLCCCRYVRNGCCNKHVFDLEKFFILRHSPHVHMDTTFALVTSVFSALQIVSVVYVYLVLHPMPEWGESWPYEWFYNHQLFHALAACFVISVGVAGYVFENVPFFKKNILDVRLATICFYFGIVLYFHSQDGMGISKSQHDFFCLLIFAGGVVKLYMSFRYSVHAIDDAETTKTGTSNNSYSHIYLDPSNKAGAEFYFAWLMVWSVMCLGLGGMGDRLYQWRLETENIFALFGFLVLIKICFVAFIAYTVRSKFNNNKNMKTRSKEYSLVGMMKSLSIDETNNDVDDNIIESKTNDEYDGK